MLTKYSKLAVAFISIAVSAYLFVDRQTGNAITVLLIALLISFFYFRNEFILIAFFKLRRQDMKAAKKWLNRIKHPKAVLIKSQRAYYYFLNGIVESQHNLTQSENFFRKALQTGLFMDHDKAMAKLNLAGAAMAKGRRREAQWLLKEAQQLDKRGLLTEQIKVVKAQFKKAHVGRNPNAMRMQRNRGRGF